MELASDLSPASLESALRGRAVRTYPALLSTEADACAWARLGADPGSIVIADYQASPRGRAGWPWQVRAGEDLGFSIVLRPELTPEREGWLYTIASLALADVIHGRTRGDRPIDWPDEVRGATGLSGAVAMQSQLEASRVSWAVISVLVRQPRLPRARLVAQLADALEGRAADPTERVLADYLPQCATLGRRVRARLIPLGPGGTEIAGTAVDSLADGALSIETDPGPRVAVRPQNLGALDYPGQGPG